MSETKHTPDWSALRSEVRHEAVRFVLPAASLDDARRLEREVQRRLNAHDSLTAQRDDLLGIACLAHDVFRLLVQSPGVATTKEWVARITDTIPPIEAAIAKAKL